MSEALRIFERNDTQNLYSIAQKLHKKGIFNYYLSHQQLLVLEQILLHSKDPKTLFNAFLNSKVSLKFVGQPPPSQNGEEEQDVPEIKDLKSQPDAKSDDTQETSNSVQLIGKASDNQTSKDKSFDQDFDSEDDIITEQSIPNGLESARSLALKVRYILYDKAVLLYYSELDNEDDYEIFEIDDTNKDPGDQPAPNQDKSKPAETNYDDDYDDDEDDEDESQPSLNTTEETGTKIDQFYDSEGNVILEVPIVQQESNQFDPKNLVVNFNNIYHNFENDLETLIKRRKLEENDKLLEDNDQSNITDLFSMNLGAANLSLKHLLRSIDDNKEKLNLPENELRQLIMDVRKNRSKWASDDKIGQEELYEACEKVVMELRGYTEYSTAFLNKVSKREAPNYSQIIKKPMDLNTILKKLKGFQYKSKTEFVDDVMLIWKNCLTYNSDPRHFLRAHAIAMQKKSLTLIPLIPDITVRDRSEVEAEAEADNEINTPVPSGKSSSKGKKRTRNGQVKLEARVSSDWDTHASVTENTTPASNIVNDDSDVGSINPDTVPTSVSGLNNISGEQTDTTSVPKPIVETTELEEDDNAEINDYLNTEDNDKDDLEMSTWKNMTSKVRADLCIKRSELFKDNRLNKNMEAILNGSKTLKDPERKRHNGKRTQALFKPTTQQKIDEDPYLIEYDMTGALPPLQYKGLDEEEIERNESKLVDKVLEQGGFSEPSEFAAKDGGLNKIINENIKEMQDIRKLCFKVSLIRQMQQQQFIHHSQTKAPEVEEINDNVDLDPVSRLDNHDKMNKDLVYAILKKRVSKIAMLSGFESTEHFAIDTLTQATADFMDNLVKTLKAHIETPSINKEHKQKNILHLSLLQNGIRKPDDLYIYVHENVLRQHSKLKDLRAKLSNFLKTLLRPAIDLTNDKTFADNSEQFISGDFSNEIGEDFFGFKELGLDKELGVLGNTIPLHLLHSRFAEVNQIDDIIHEKREDFEKAPFKRIKDDEIINEVGLIQPFLQNVILERTKIFNAKQIKSKKDVQEYMKNAKGVTLLDDEDYPKKQQKPKLTHIGKLSSAKKKITPQTFFLPEDGNQVKLEDISVRSGNSENRNGFNGEINDVYDDDDPLASQATFAQGLTN